MYFHPSGRATARDEFQVRSDEDMIYKATADDDVDDDGADFS